MRNTHRVTETELPHADDEMLTLKEVATLLRVPEATVRFWRHQSKGPRGFRVGRSVRYWRTEVAVDTLARRTVPQPPGRLLNIDRLSTTREKIAHGEHSKETQRPMASPLPRRRRA